MNKLQWRSFISKYLFHFLSQYWTIQKIICLLDITDADPELQGNANILPDQGQGHLLLIRSGVCGRRDLDLMNVTVRGIPVGCAGLDHGTGCGHVIGIAVGHVNGSWDATTTGVLIGPTDQGEWNYPSSCYLGVWTGIHSTPEWQ